MTVDFTTIIPCSGPASIDAVAVRNALRSMDPNGSLEIIIGDTAAADTTASKGAMVSHEGLLFTRRDAC